MKAVDDREDYVRRPDIYERNYLRSGYSQERCGTCLECEYERAREIIAAVYGPNLIVSGCEDAPSLVVRNENELGNKDAPRFTKRLHIFEDMGYYKEYVGFMSVRITDDRDNPPSPIAEAILRPPRRMRFPPYHVTCLGYYSSYIGVLPFEGSPYTMHDPRLGALCAQGSIFLSLLMMVPFGARVLGPATITALISPKPRKKTVLNSKGRRELNINEFIIRGFKVSEMVKFLRSELSDTSSVISENCGIDKPGYSEQFTNISAIHESFDMSNTEHREEFTKSMISYLHQRFPIVLPIKWNKLYPNDKLDHDPGHAIVVIGYRKIETGTYFVYHDGRKGAYQERDSHDLIESAVGHEEESSKFGFIVPVPKGIRIRSELCTELVKELVKCSSELSHDKKIRIGDKLSVPRGQLNYRETVLVNSRRLDDFLLSKLAESGKRLSFQGYMESLNLPNFVWCQMFFKTRKALNKREPFLCWLYDTEHEIEHDFQDPELGFRYPVLAYLLYSNRRLRIYKIQQDA